MLRGRTLSTFLIVVCGMIAIAATSVLGQDHGSHSARFLDRLRGHHDPEFEEIITVGQLAELIDRLDKSLDRRGQVVVKAPDVWGQNRMTQYRAEYEEQMKP